MKVLFKKRRQYKRNKDCDLGIRMPNDATAQAWESSGSEMTCSLYFCFRLSYFIKNVWHLEYVKNAATLSVHSKRKT